MAGLVKTTVRIQEQLFWKLRVLASVRGKTFSNALNEAIKEYVQNHEEEMRKRLTEVVGTP
jgi:predicted DNA-binding protein